MVSFIGGMKKIQQTRKYIKKEVDTDIESKVVVTSGKREEEGTMKEYGIKKYILLGIK